MQQRSLPIEHLERDHRAAICALAAIFAVEPLIYEPDVTEPDCYEAVRQPIM